MTVKSTTELRPWSYRQNALVKSLITIAAGVASAFVGTFAHRMGAELNIPYGLVLAFLLIGLSTWCARSRMGAVGLALHLIASSLTAWGMALTTHPAKRSSSPDSKATCRSSPNMPATSGCTA